ncbi:MAG: metal ABC transporter solute-binding protein, Zn/Mn family [Bacteroidales bacterium]
MIKRYSVVLLLFVGLLFSFGCARNAEVKSKPTVVVSILPLKYFVEKIADSTVQVKVLVPPGSSPEMYEPAPSQLVDFSTADAYFAIGLLDFEKGLEPKLKDGYKAKYINLSEGANLMEGSCTHHGEEHAEGEHNHGVDPHIWVSVNEAKRIANVMLSILSEVYPEQKERFLANHSKLLAKIDSVNAAIQSTFAKSGTKAFLIYHPALGYFARDYGITQLSIEEEGKNPSAGGIINTIKASKEQGIKSVLSQSQFDIHNAQAIASEIGGSVVKVDPLAENWDESMIQIAKAISGE